MNISVSISCSLRINWNCVYKVFSFYIYVLLSIHYMPGNIQIKELYIIPSALIFMLVRMGTRTLLNELCHLPYIHSFLPLTMFVFVYSRMMACLILICLFSQAKSTNQDMKVPITRIFHRPKICIPFQDIILF